jgi:MFS family permease
MFSRRRNGEARACRRFKDANMPPNEALKAPAVAAASGPWYRGLTGYHWFVLIVCSLGWLFDTMDQQLFVLARTPALTALLGEGVAKADIARYGGYVTTIFMLGWATGGLLFGLLGDRWGRAKTMLLTIVLYSAFTGLSALSRTWIDFSIFRFLTGMGVGGEFAAGVSLVAEVMPTRARPYALALLQALSALGNMTAAGVSFLLPPQSQVLGLAGWRLMFVFGILPAILVILVMRRLKEPDSWVKAKEAEARGEGHHKGRGMGSLKELFLDRRWRHNTLVGVALALAGVVGVWGVAFWMSELVRNNALANLDKPTQDWYASLASLLQNAGAGLGIYAYGLLAARVGRRPAFAVSFIAAMAVVMGVFGFMTQPWHVWWMAPMLGFATLMAFGGYTIYFPELFPTRLRATGTGFCYNVARYLSAFAPSLLGALAVAYTAPAGTARAAAGLSDLTFLSSLGSVDNAFRYAAITIACIYMVGLIALRWAPETRDKALPE